LIIQKNTVLQKVLSGARLGLDIILGLYSLYSIYHTHLDMSVLWVAAFYVFLDDGQKAYGQLQW
jgi:hypothetical protein